MQETLEEEMKRSRQRNPYSVPLRIFRRLIIALLLLGVPAIIFINTFQIKTLEVVGEKRYTQEQIKAQVIQTKLDTNSLCLYLKYRYFKDIRLPFVEKIDVKMMDQQAITIYVYEKMIAGCVEFMGEYLYFDKDGIVVESSGTKLEDVPVVKGLKFNKIILSEKLKVQKEELFDLIINLTQLIEKNDLNIDIISFSKQYEVTLYSNDIKILLGKQSTYDEALSALKGILKEAEGMNITINMEKYVKGTEIIIAKPNNKENR